MNLDDNKNLIQFLEAILFRLLLIAGTCKVSYLDTLSLKETTIDLDLDNQSLTVSCDGESLPDERIKSLYSFYIVEFLKETYGRSFLFRIGDKTMEVFIKEDTLGFSSVDLLKIFTFTNKET